MRVESECRFFRRVDARSGISSRRALTNLTPNLAETHSLRPRASARAGKLNEGTAIHERRGERLACLCSTLAPERHRARFAAPPPGGNLNEGSSMSLAPELRTNLNEGRP